METVEFEISKGELFCLAAIQGYDSLINVEYEHEDLGIDLMPEFNRLTERLRKRKWLYEDFDGNMTIALNMAATMSLCGTAERFWIVRVHINKSILVDHVYTIYNIGSMYLSLEQIDSKNYYGVLASDFNRIRDSVLIRTPFVDSKHTNTGILLSELESVTEREQYALISINEYAVETDENERSVVCENASMVLFLERLGTFALQIGDDGSGGFFPISQDEYDNRIKSIFN